MKFSKYELMVFSLIPVGIFLVVHPWLMVDYYLWADRLTITVLFIVSYFVLIFGIISSTGICYEKYVRKG